MRASAPVSGSVAPTVILAAASGVAAFGLHERDARARTLNAVYEYLRAPILA